MSSRGLLSEWPEEKNSITKVPERPKIRHVDGKKNAKSENNYTDKTEIVEM